MSRLAITRETLLALFARSGNVCAFPGCTHELVTNRNLFVGQICHIEAANCGGQRFNPNSTDEDRRSFNNLILFCYKHHRETDDVRAFKTDDLRKMKFDHESKHGEKPFKINEAFLRRIETEMETYWSKLTFDNKTAHVVPEFAVPVPVGIPANTQFREIFEALDPIMELFEVFHESDESLNKEIREFLVRSGYDLAKYDAIPQNENPFIDRNWELHSLGVANAYTDLVMVLKQTEVRFLEEYVKTHPNDFATLDRLSSAKEELRQMAISAGYVD